MSEYFSFPDLKEGPYRLPPTPGARPKLFDKPGQLNLGPISGRLPRKTERPVKKVSTYREKSETE
jgi:hypothetical protein